MSGHAYTAEGVGAQRAPSPRAELPSALVAAGVAAACVVAMALVYLVSAHLPSARLRDAGILHDFTRLDRPWTETWGGHLLHLLEPARFTLWSVAIVCFGVARGRPRLAVAVGVVLAFAPLSADVLKPLLAHHHDTIGHTRVGEASWPSGHATAALALVLSALLVAPRRWRLPVALAGGAYVVAVGLALLILAWHMPSDVVGGYLLAMLWAALAVTVLRWSEWRRPPRRG